MKYHAAVQGEDFQSLDAAWAGALGRALRRIATSTEHFQSLAEDVTSHLRKGRTRLVIVVDAAPSNLCAMVARWTERVDLHLFVGRKVQTDEVCRAVLAHFDPKARSAELSTEPFAGSKRRGRQRASAASTAPLAAVVRHYGGMPGAHPLDSAARGWQIVQVPGSLVAPWKIRYAFIDRDGRLSADIHAYRVGTPEDVASLDALFAALLQRLVSGTNLAAGRIQHPTQLLLGVSFEPGTPSATVAVSMQTLIEATQPVMAAWRAPSENDSRGLQRIGLT